MKPNPDSRDDHKSDLSNNPFCFMIEFYSLLVLVFVCAALVSVYKIWTATSTETTLGYWAAFIVSALLVYILIKAAKHLEKTGHPKK